MKANHKIMAALAGIVLGALTIIVPGDAAHTGYSPRTRYHRKHRWRDLRDQGTRWRRK